MKSLIAVAGLLFAATAAQAQIGVTPGIGAGIQPFLLVEDTDALTVANRVGIYFPVQLNEKFRVEPSFSYLSSSAEVGDFTSSTSTWSLGTGLFYTSSIREPVPLVHRAENRSELRGR